MRRYSLPLTINLAIAVAVLFPYAAGFAASAAGGWQAHWEQTLAAAKQEGQVTIYGGEEITHPDIIAQFNKGYPEIKVVTVTGHSEVIQRIIAERRAERYLVDLFAYGPNAARTAYLAKFLDPIPPVLILPEVADTSKWFGGLGSRGQVCFYL
jgi:ABC-type glycerol-3-phosphate transport system substrate-binding protein